MKIICRSREYTVALICFTVVFLFADQNLLAPNLSLIAREFHFSNAQRDDLLGAKIALGFFVIGGVVSLVVGYLTDSVCRIPLFSFIVLLGEMACLLTNWTKTYLQLYICRVLTGISIGGATPVVFSLLADFYPNNSRVKISTFIGISMSCGIAFGQLLAGVVGPTAGWRLPFVLVAVPAILFAILIFFTGIEPKRGGQEEAVRSLRRNKRSAMAAVVTTQPVESIYSPMWRRAIGYYWKTKYSNMEQNSSELEQLSPPATADVFDPATEESETPSCNESGIEYSERADFKKALGLLQNRSALIVFLQGVPACLPWGMVYTFLNDYLSNDRGQTVMQATLALTCFGIGGFFGQVAGGAAGQQLYNRDKRLQCVLMGGSTMIATFPMLFLINNTRAGTGFFFMAALSGFVVSMNGPNVRAVLQNVCAPETRGTAFSLFNLTDDLGKGFGPVIVVALIEACQGDRRTAFTIVTLFWMIGGALLLLLVCTVEADEQRVQDTVRASLLRTHLALASADPTNGVHVPVAEHCEVCGKVISSGVSVTETLSAIITVRFEAVPSAFCACRGRQGSSTDCTSHSYGTLDDISILEDSADRTSKP